MAGVEMEGSSLGVKASPAASLSGSKQAKKIVSSLLCRLHTTSSKAAKANASEAETTMAKDEPELSKGEPIPRPPGFPLVGHALAIDKNLPIEAFLHYAKKYGPIYQMDVFGDIFIVLSSHDLVYEICDEKRFKKCIDNEISELRPGVHDGLFTASGEEEENWGIAHRILVPAFGPLAIRSMFPEMHDIASQMALKWARQGPLAPVDLADDLTRLAMDTLALCTMGFRFNSYYRSDMHPFIDAMYGFLRAASDRTLRPPGLPSVVFRKADKKFERDIALLRSTAEELLNTRKAEMAAGGVISQRKDLLNAMLQGVDKKTGKKMTDQSIIDNMITFLIAGHETTASSLSFILYRLMAHPEVYHKAQEEIDKVIGKESLTLNHIARLKYLTAVIRETMRFHPSIPFIARESLQDTVVGGKYHVKAKVQFVPMIQMVHMDPAVYGDDAEEFKPERMLDEQFDERMRRFPQCWMPFGTGMRACIGRPFAWQEMMLALALLLQNFKFVKHDPGYELRIAQTLTVKPVGFQIRAIPRDGLTPAELEARLVGGLTAAATAAEAATHGAKSQYQGDATDGSQVPQIAVGDSKPLTILYGSNSGTCEFMAQRLAGDATRHGFRATVDTLDAATEALPKDRPVVLITASYEGEPTHNAAHFVRWLEGLAGSDQLKGVRYAVYGCGHRDWVQTLHKIPRLIDQRLAELGAERLVEMGVTDAKERDMFSDFEAWEHELFWPAVGGRSAASSVRNGISGGEQANDDDTAAIEVALSTPRATILHQDVYEASVVTARVLAYRDDGSSPSKGHVEIKLPEGMKYTTGDYMAVLPHNPKATVARVLSRFGLAWDAHVTIKAPGPTVLPTGGSVAVMDLLTSYVELGITATRRNIAALEKLAVDAETREKLRYLASEGYDEKVREKQLSVLGIAEQFPDLAVPFSAFLSLLPPMRVRQYSISSSPLVDPTTASITYSVLDVPSASGRGRHIGVCSSYLSALEPGQRVQASVRPGTRTFRPPTDPSTPVIMVAAGTGIAPFRGFVQERAEMIRARGGRGAEGARLGPALLFFGCRAPGPEDLYRDELDGWAAAGAVDAVHRAYSRDPSASDGCRHVQDRLRRERREVLELWERGARLYVCGSSKMGDGVKDAMLDAFTERARDVEGREMARHEAEAYFQSIRSQRYAVDVFD